VLTRGAARVTIVAAGALVVLTLLGLIFEAAAEAVDARVYPPPGRLVDIGGYRLHLLCLGQGSRTVLLEASHGGTVAHWVRVQESLAQSVPATICAYDRAGAGWSDTGPEPRDASHMASELDRLLTAGGIGRPIVLVAHSFGGLVARVFATEHPRDVRAVVLLEGLPPDFWLRQGLPESTANGAPVPLEGAGVAARLGVLRLTGFPPADVDLPAREYAEARAFQSSARFGDLLAAVERSFRASLAQGRATGSLGDTPLLVLLGGASEANDPLPRQLQEEQVRLSTRGSLGVVDGATHNGLLTSPALAPVTVQLITRFLASL
jgi:pimeloyl-ACP methyl ester carboxylesterase